MQQYLLDTCTCAFIFRNKFGVNEKLLEIGIDNCHISEITYAELLFSAENSQNVVHNRILLDNFLENINCISIFNAIPIYAKEKVRLRRKGTPIDDFDLLIGATAVSEGMTLVTENVKHFTNIQNIKLENWVNRQS